MGHSITHKYLSENPVGIAWDCLPTHPPHTPPPHSQFSTFEWLARFAMLCRLGAPAGALVAACGSRQGPALCKGEGGLWPGEAPFDGGGQGLPLLGLPSSWAMGQTAAGVALQHLPSGTTPNSAQRHQAGSLRPEKKCARCPQRGSKARDNKERPQRDTTTLD